MATETLAVNLLLNAGQYKREAGQASTATGKIAGSAKGAATETSRLDRQLGNTGFTMRHAVTAGAIAGGAALFEFGKDSVRAASDLQESMNAVNVVFGESADGIHAIGEEAADSFGMAQSTFNDFAVRFSAFGEQIASRSGRNVVDVVDEMAGRIADFASVHNLSLERAAEVAQSTLAGETEVFRRFGGDVSAAAVEAKLLEEGIVETGEAMSEQDKIMGRYMLFMEQTDKTAGDFKNTQDDLANATRTLGAEMEQFKARAGTELLPVMGELTSQGLQLFDILDPDINLGWTQRLSAGIQLITGEGSEAVKTYIEQKEAANDYADGVDDLTTSLTENEQITRDAVTAVGDLKESTEGVGDASGSSAGEMGELTGETRRLFGTTEDLAGAQFDLEFETRRVVGAMKAQHDRMRAQTDPLFALEQASRDAAEAQKAINEAVEEHGEGSPEHLAAIRDAAEANLDLKGAALDVRDATDLSREEFVKQQVQLGLTRDEAELLADQFEALEDFDFEPKRIKVIADISPEDRALFGSAGMRVTAPRRETQSGSGAFVERQHGGPLRAGQPAIVGEDGPELFIPQQSGMVVPNGGASAGTPAAGTTVINNHFMLTWGDFLRKAADAGLEIQRYGW